MKVIVDTHMRVPLRNLPEGALARVFDELTIINPEFDPDSRQHNVPEYVYLCRTALNQLIMPRGYARRFCVAMSELQAPVEFSDQRVGVSHQANGATPVKLREHQVPAVESIIRCEQGIYMSPTGSGKTVTVLEAIRRLGQRSLIVVDKSNIALQWQERAKTFLDIELGFIGDGRWEEADVTVAMVQTLWMRRNETPSAFWGSWGLVCLDECHHSPANTFSGVMQKFPARWRFGVSATPDRENGTFPIALAVLGEVFHMTPRDELVNAGILLQPELRVVKTDFKFEFNAMSTSQKRKQYTALLKVIAEDRGRNALISQTILTQRGHANLVLSRRLGHLDELRRLVIAGGWPEDRAVMLTGRELAEKRMEVAQLAAAGDIVIFSTIADEALDIPRLDRIHLTWPARNGSLVKQQVGRIMRTHDEKKDAVIFDYVDAMTGVLMKQFGNRMKAVYVPERIRITGL